MEAKLKLEEAEYFLAKLKSLDNTVAKCEHIETITNEFAYNLSAFISAWRSVWDVLHHDFAEKYFDVSRDVGLRWDKFKGIFTKKQDTKSIIEWCEKKYNILKENPLWEIRHHNIHRGIIGIDREQRPYPINNMYGSITVEDAPRKKYKSEPSASSRESQNLRFVFRFGHRYIKQVEGKIITPICEDAIKLMKDIVNEASEKI